MKLKTELTHSVPTNDKTREKRRGKNIVIIQSKNNRVKKIMIRKRGQRKGKVGLINKKKKKKKHQGKLLVKQREEKGAREVFFEGKININI